MSDNFNENGFASPEEEEVKPQNDNSVSKNEDVFDFLSGDSFYGNAPEEKEEVKKEEPSEPIYEEVKKEEPFEPVYEEVKKEEPLEFSAQEKEPEAPYVPHTSESIYSEPVTETKSNGYSAPFERSEPYRPQPPVQPYEFGRGGYNNAPYGDYDEEPQKPKKLSAGKIIVAAVILVCMVIGFKSMWEEMIKPGITDSTTEVTTAGEAVVAPGDQVQISPTQQGSVSQLNSVQVAEKASPSVVGVMTYMNGQLSGEGSGVAMSIDSSGKYTYIITCAHVISEKGVTYGVLTSEKKNYEAELVAYDVRTDIGVLKVEATDIPLAEFGDSKALKVGEPVYAIGNPGGSEFFGSFTDGIVSAIDRSISGTYTMTCIQHNAAINPGNSGGALVNSAGQVIGINSSKISATDYEGMGFAVPMSIVKPVVDSLIQYKYVPNRPKLGIEYASVSAYQLYSMVVAIKGLPSGSLVIAGISSDSSLANTDAQVGDLIIAVNGKPMDSSDVLLDMISTGAVGDSLTLTLCRVENRTYQTSTFDVTITLVEDKGEAMEEETTAAPYNGGYYYGGQSSFEDFFNEYFGF